MTLIDDYITYKIIVSLEKSKNISCTMCSLEHHSIDLEQLFAHDVVQNDNSTQTKAQITTD